ncbi:cyclic peptide export ABC transporter [Aquimarina algiphila]|uniref:cyclic peptide export ABC transporter n=1 Tax=Aquimarina algiphila TaxID=2047982 RepID=UPI00232C6D61|nr:cyclic peptide export ABC transporter [Aquimarina algiphila]
MKEKSKKNKIKFEIVFPIVGYSFLAIISGLASFVMILLINRIINISLNNELAGENNYFLMFVSTILIFFLSRRILAEGIISFSQKVYWGIRKDIIKLVLQAPYRKLEVFKDKIYSTLTADVANITNASLLIINFFSSLIILIVCLIYLANLSFELFLVSVGVIMIGFFLYKLSSYRGRILFNVVRDLEQDFMNGFNDILNGGKEININVDKGTDIFEKKLLGIIMDGEQKNVVAWVSFLNSQIIGQILFYGLITFVLIYAGKSFDISSETIVSFVFVLLYILGPITNVMNGIPSLNNAIISLGKINELKRELKIYTETSTKIRTNKGQSIKFERLDFRNYSFSFGENEFSIGPINLVLNKNEVVFIYGGNGSGKTTFINTIIGLYEKHNGETYLNNNLVDISNIDKIKSMFSPVFSDFYLFKEFYGIEFLDIEKANKLIVLFELEEKVFIKEGKFSSINLSTGQRKRLALISALLENRPIILLDEWAADQDPYFRNKFYTKIIPYMVKEEKKTIVAITHDDKYFCYADRLFKMEYGKLEEVSKSKQNNIFK